uniref:KANL3/Tex30 alpha/beta hydrolase-like domain-containing protein n=2 Tax=Hordeum vulgare subsp. vulgare TaxID=112509 RepID=A0A287HHZ4_HORVV
MARKRRRADQCTTAPSPPPPFWTKLTHRQPVVVFPHGAGAPSSSDWMTHWKEMVKDALDAIEVVTFDYPYMSGGKRRPPPKADKLVDHHLSVVKNVVAEHPGHPLVLMRKSMGSR